MTVLVAPDSFKGTFSATEVAAAIACGCGDEPVDLAPVADGGEGTAEVLLAARGGTLVEAAATDPLGAPVRARFALLADGVTAVVETAAASGLPLVADRRRDASGASTYGTGQLIVAALEAGARRVVVAAGGSATTDGGAGAIDAIRAAGVTPHALEVLVDVDTPFERAAIEFGPQKGASSEEVAALTVRLHDFAATLPSDPRGVPGTGAAGGLAGGLWATFGAALRPGAPYVLDAIGFAPRLRAAAAVIIGEGALDAQSLRGKVTGTVAEWARTAGVPCHAIVGRCRLHPADAGLASVTEATTLAEIESAAARITANLRPQPRV